ncbi:hypothetical protein IAR50_002763 [Cryptococcus sp. DSM 104548]
MSSNAREGRFVTLEHFIHDTFTRIDDTGAETPVDKPDQVGGGGTFAIIGARIFLPPSKLGLIIDHTSETLPQTLKDDLRAYGEEMWEFRERKDGNPTTRAVNRYQGDKRGFEYLSKPLILTPKSLEGTAFGDPLPAVTHFISYPAPRAANVLGEMEALRKSRGWEPLVVWEPEDEEIDAVTVLAPHIDILGPNHNEALALYALFTGPEFTDDDLKPILERVCRSLAHLQPRIGAIIRAGHMGCCYAALDPRGYRPEVKWVPAYWGKEVGREGWERKVVDPTGAGNAFMGGVAAALLEGKTFDDAVKWGTVAASFVIEQDGLPTLTKGEDGKELWNGEDPWERLKAL